MEEWYWIKRDVIKPDQIIYILTPEGWFSGIKRLGELDSPETFNKANNLKRALAEVLKDRKEDGRVNAHDIAKETGLSTDWTLNVVESGLLMDLFPKEHTRLD